MSSNLTWHDDAVLLCYFRFCLCWYFCAVSYVCFITFTCAHTILSSLTFNTFVSLFTNSSVLVSLCRPLVDVCVIVKHKALLKRLWFKLDFLKGQDQRFVGVLIVMMTLTQNLYSYFVCNQIVDIIMILLHCSADYILNMTMIESKSVIVMLWSVCWTWIIVIFGLADAVRFCLVHDLLVLPSSILITLVCKRSTLTDRPLTLFPLPLSLSDCLSCFRWVSACVLIWCILIWCDRVTLYVYWCCV